MFQLEKQSKKFKLVFPEFLVYNLKTQFVIIVHYAMTKIDL